MKGFVYILRSLKDNKKYIGSTTNITRRLKEHNTGKVRSTKRRRPFVLEHVLEYNNIKIAAKMERQFKRSHGALERELKKHGD